MYPLRLELAVCFFDLDDHEAVGLPNDAPAPSTLRLVPRPDYPPAVGVVNLVLLGPRHLDYRDALESTALTPTRAKRVHSAFGHHVLRKSGTATHGKQAGRAGLEAQWGSTSPSRLAPATARASLDCSRLTEGVWRIPCLARKRPNWIIRVRGCARGGGDDSPRHMYRRRFDAGRRRGHRNWRVEASTNEGAPRSCGQARGPHCRETQGGPTGRQAR
jgi:hypothetical protein